MAIMLRILKTEDWFQEDGFPVSIERRDPQEPFGLHAHEFSELVIITGGRGMHVVGKESWPLAAGDVFVIGGTRPHDYKCMDNLRLINILYQPSKLQMGLFDLAKLPGYHVLFTLEPAWRKRHQFKSRLHLSPVELSFVLGRVDRLDDELRRREPGFGFMSMALFMEIIGYLSRCYSHSRNPDSHALLRIAEAITHLEAHYTQPINLNELARKADMSKRSFLRAFQAAMNRSPIAYLIQLRINHAANLLRHEEDSITDIAFRVGFSDSNYFTRQFKQYIELSPRDYRRQYQNISAITHSKLPST